MNERIKELVGQADPDYTGNADDDMGNALVGNEAIEQFALLIVGECAGLCSATAAGRDAEAIEEAILKHFGVEE